jgi:hypothetical protein
MESAEFEAEIMAHRVDIHALCVEARRVEGEGGDVWELGATIPSGWLSAMAQGLDYVMDRWRYEDPDKFADGQVSDETALEDVELFEQMTALASALRDVEPGGIYVVGSHESEALLKAAAGALEIKEYEVLRLSEYVEPAIVRFLAIEQRDAVGSFADVLWDLPEIVPGA